MSQKIGFIRPKSTFDKKSGHGFQSRVRKDFREGSAMSTRFICYAKELQGYEYVHEKFVGGNVIYIGSIHCFKHFPSLSGVIAGPEPYTNHMLSAIYYHMLYQAIL